MKSAMNQPLTERVIRVTPTIECGEELCGFCQFGVFGMYGDGEICVLFNKRIRERKQPDKFRCLECFEAERRGSV